MGTPSLAKRKCASVLGGKPTRSTVSPFDISRNAAAISKLERLAAAIS
jgi:hypothetical protein